MRRIEKHARPSEIPYTAVGSRHVRVGADGRLIPFANRTRRDEWLRAQTGRIVKNSLRRRSRET